MPAPQQPDSQDPDAKRAAALRGLVGLQTSVQHGGGLIARGAFWATYWGGFDRMPSGVDWAP